MPKCPSCGASEAGNEPLSGCPHCCSSLAPSVQPPPEDDERIDIDELIRSTLEDPPNAEAAEEMDAARAFECAVTPVMGFRVETPPRSVAPHSTGSALAPRPVLRPLPPPMPPPRRRVEPAASTPKEKKYPLGVIASYLVVAVLGAGGFALVGLHSSASSAHAERAPDASPRKAEQTAAGERGRTTPTSGPTGGSQPPDMQSTSALSLDDPPTSKPSPARSWPSGATTAGWSSARTEAQAPATSESAMDAAASTSTAKPSDEPTAPRPFDRSAARRALAGPIASAAQCSSDMPPSGPAQVSVTFAPSGRSTQTIVTGAAFTGTALGTCVASRFRGVHIEPFEGDPITVSVAVTVTRPVQPSAPPVAEANTALAAETNAR